MRRWSRGNSTNRVQIRWAIKKLVANSNNGEFMFILTILEKIEETKVAFQYYR